MSIRYFEVYQESDKEDETERYLCSDRADAITMANSIWWEMPEEMRENLDYFCVEEYDVDDDFGEHTNEVVVRTWKNAADADFSDLTRKDTARMLVNIANTYADNEKQDYISEVSSENYANVAALPAEKQEAAKKIINDAWEKSRNGGNY